MSEDNAQVTICRWLNDAPFAYSMTYDEGTVDCLSNALPIHQQFGFPGHVDVVAGQLGQKRHAYGSSLNDYIHMGAAELKFLLDQGWGVGNHSWSHYVYPLQPGLDLWREVVWSKYQLEDLLDRPVRIFTIPNDKYNYEPVLDLVRQYYLACAYIEGGPNRDDFDLYRIGNFMVASGQISEGYDWKKELLTENLDADFLEGAWLYETTHLVMWNVPQSHKCVTPEDLTRRFEKLRDISGGRLWAATPDQVVDYVLLRRAVSVNVLEANSHMVKFEITGDWPVGVVDSKLTLRVAGLSSTWDLRGRGEAKVISDRLPCAALRSEVCEVRPDGSDWLVTMDVVPGRVVEIPVFDTDLEKAA